MHYRLKLAAYLSTLLLSTITLTQPQNYDPQKSESPMSLLSAPKDPIAYMEARENLQNLIKQGKAAEAEPVAEQIVREYPRDGENWLALGQIKRALKKYSEAATAFEKARTLLCWGGGSAGVGAAISHLHAGNKRAALDRLREYTLKEGNMDTSWIYDEDDFASVKTDPEFLAIAGRFDTTGWSRDDGWRRDLEFLRSEVKRLNADYRTSPLPVEFERRYEELKKKIHQLSDEQIFVGMNRMLAVLRQGHTEVTPQSDSRVPAKGLPFQLWAFPEGIFIIDAAEPHKDLVGYRLISIEGVPAEEALRRLNEVQSVDGDSEYLFEGTNRLRSLPYLIGLGIVKSSDSTGISVQKPGQEKKEIKVGTPPYVAPNKLVAPPSVKTPLYLQDQKQYHWHQALPEHDAFYVQINGLANDRDETLGQYGLRLRTVLSEAAPKNLIVDMRHNNGGSTHLYAELLRTMIGFSVLPGRQVYVLIGRRTYSAAGNFITELEQLANAVFVGEASGEASTFYASPSPFTLPFSKLRSRQPTRRINLSRKGHDFRRELHPHAPIQLTAKDHFEGRDTGIETVFRLIRRNAAKPAGS